MKVIGVTGGVGSGKSTVMHLIEEEYFCETIIADEIGRKLMEKGNKSHHLIIEYFGDDIVDTDGEIDRKKLGDFVFQDKEKLNKLNSFIHPYVREYVEERIQFRKLENKIPYLFIESAILFEAGYEILCDEVWYVYADSAERRERLRKNRNYSEEKINSILANQLDENEFCNKCTKIIYNNSEIATIKKQLQIMLVK